MQHRFKNPEIAFARGERLIRNEGAPTGVKGLQFYPSRDGSAATCLWEAPSVDVVQRYVDSTLGDSSENSCYEVASEKAFAARPS
ncbi:MAG TPA: hypothetical protein VJ260_05865, partial [Vicinamibacterales bacterium]|nr:hypothetical protein [Vicinamibacterales bacterium]